MTIEKSHGKARPTLPRSSDLESIDNSVGNPTAGRGPGGRFIAGNRISVKSGFAHTVRKSLGIDGSTGAELIVAKDAKRLFGNVLATLPSDAAPVRALLAVYSRHQALHAYYSNLAECAGLSTPDGLKYVDLADKQSLRAERTLVTCHDLAKIHATSKPRNELPPGMVEVDE